MFERKKQAGKIYFLPIDQIRPSPFQARREFSEQELAALAQSIRENGLLQPISVRKVSDGGYELVAGERRLRACRLAKMNTIPAILCDYDDERTAALGLLENIQRADLNPFEQAQGLKDVEILIWTAACYILQVSPLMYALSQWIFSSSRGFSPPWKVRPVSALLFSD